MQTRITVAPLVGKIVCIPFFLTVGAFFLTSGIKQIQGKLVEQIPPWSKYLTIGGGILFLGLAVLLFFCKPKKSLSQ